MTESLKARFDGLIQHILAATAEVEAGKSIELKDLEQQVTTLCNDVMKAGPQAGQALRPSMAVMIARLDQLAARLAEYQKNLKEQQ